jgi:RNA polymerase sigma factor (sigma-70 family)
MRNDSELLALVAAARGSRDAGELERAAAAWKTLVGRQLGRVRELVAAFRFPGHPEVRVAQGESEDAAQAALERCLGPLERTFRGSTAPEFRAAVATCVRFACMDFCRRRMRWERRLAGSLDEPALTPDRDPGGEQAGRFDRETGAIAARLHDRRSDARLRIDAVAGALRLLPNENMRAVLRLSGEGYSSTEVAERLQLTSTNVDQLRSRGFRRLGEALDAPAAPGGSGSALSGAAGRRRRRRSASPTGPARRGGPGGRHARTALRTPRLAES